MKSKFESRKFWAAIVGVIVGVAMTFGLDENTISVVSGAIMALTSVVTYIATEGKIDAEGVKRAAEAVQEAKDVLSDE